MERIITDGGHRIRQREGFKGFAAVEGVDGDGGHPLRDRDGFEVGAAAPDPAPVAVAAGAVAAGGPAQRGVDGGQPGAA